MKRFQCDDCKRTVRLRKINILDQAMFEIKGQIDRPVKLCNPCALRHTSLRAPRPCGTHKATAFEMFSLGRK